MPFKMYFTCGILMRVSSRMVLDKVRFKLSVQIPRRTFIGKDLLRFYKNVSISQTEGGFEVNLDKRKLKTPLGQLFCVPTEALALSVATEWDAQTKLIKRHYMPMTSLCNTAIDNPTHRSKATVINGILEFLDTDTVCYRAEEPPELEMKMSEQWDPLLNWVKDRYGIDIQPTSGLGVPHIPSATLDVFQKHLESFNDWALVGYQQAVESIKSLIIVSCLVDRHITVEQAVDLSRLEQDFQVSHWGNVEWHHDVDLMELRTRLASATLFVHLNSEDTRTVFSKQNSRQPV